MNQLRAELLKVRTTRTTLALALGMVGLVLLFTLLGGFLTPASDLARKNDQFQVIGAGAAATLFAALVGVMLMTTEFRYGTIRPTLLYQSRRERVVAAKIAAALLSGVVFGAIAEGLALLVGLGVFAIRGIDRDFTGPDLLQIGLGTVAVSALWAAIGAGIGAIVRHQVGAIVGLLAYLFVAENLLFGLAPSVGRYAPGPSGQALLGDTNSHLLSAVAGGFLLVGYTLLFAVLGAVLTIRRDVD